MKKLLLISLTFLLIPILANSQWLEMGKQKIGNKVGIQSSGAYQWALDFDDSTEYLSCVPALRLVTGEYSAVKTSITADSVFTSNEVYGSWSFTLNKTGADDVIDLYFVNDLNVISGNSGYLLKYGADEKVYLYSVASGTPTARITSAGTYAIADNHTVVITRNTNGAFNVLVNGASIGTVTNATYTNSNYCYVDVTGTCSITSLAFQQGEGSLDLNSYERIYHSDNRTFGAKTNMSWTTNGTHSIDTSSTDKRTGTYSGKLISTDVGDSTTNFVNLPNANFDTLKQDVNGVYEKYTLEFWVKSKGVSALPRINVRIGNQLKQSDTISNIAFEKFVFNFQSNALVLNQDIKMWVNQADTVYVDDISLTKTSDITINTWAYTPNDNSSSRGFVGVDNWTNTLGYMLWITNSNAYKFTMPDLSEKLFANSYIKTNWYVLTLTISRTGYAKLYRDGVVLDSISIPNTAKSISNYFGIGAIPGLTSYYNARMGHIQIVKFTDISQSNVNSTTLTTAYNRGKLISGEWTGGSPIEVGFWDWKGADITEILRDKSGTGNNLTGANITIDDRIKVKGKFK